MMRAVRNVPSTPPTIRAKGALEGLRRALALLVLTVAFSSVGAGLAHADSASNRKSVVDKVLGCHAFAGGDKERKALAEAIDEVASDFNFVLRPIVRSRLEEANPVIERLCLARRGDAVTVSLDERKYSAPLSGKPVKVTGITGDELALHLKVGKTSLWQIFQGDEGGRINGFGSTESGNVEMKVRVFSERLPRDLIYTLTYSHK